MREEAGVFACRYAPYAQVFSRAAAIVHQGGIGTTSEALRAGMPTLVVPFGADQPDNAARVAGLGVGLVLGRGQYRAARAGYTLRRLLDEPVFAQRAAELAALVKAEGGMDEACDRIQSLLDARKSARASRVAGVQQTGAKAGRGENIANGSATMRCYLYSRA